MTNQRYSRQILYKNIGVKGQEKLNRSHVLIIGMGALGTHLAEGLVRAGVDTITIVDRDYIEHSNLQRQTLFTEQDANQSLPKVVAAEQHLKEIRSDVNIHAHVTQVDVEFLNRYGKHVDLILDGTDNFETRQLINDFAYQNDIPWIYGGVVQGTYTEAAFIPGITPCFNCLIPQIPSVNLTCDTVGVIQPAVTMATSLQLRDAIKILTQADISSKLTYGDIWEGAHFSIGFNKMKRNQCPTCGQHPTYPFLTSSHHQYSILCGRDTVQYQNDKITQGMLLNYLKDRAIPFQNNNYLIMFKFDGYRVVNFKDGRFLIHGMKDKAQASQLINQLFG